jgi:chromosome segregation ATPase
MTHRLAPTVVVAVARRDARASTTSRPTTTTRAFGDAGPGAFFRSDKTEINRLKYVIENAERHAREHAEARRVAERALGDVESSRDMYKRRLEASEREVFALEKALEEKTRGVETAMAIARRQIAYQEERYARLVEEHEALRARVGETSE